MTTYGAIPSVLTAMFGNGWRATILSKMNTLKNTIYNPANNNGNGHTYDFVGYDQIPYIYQICDGDNDRHHNDDHHRS